MSETPAPQLKYLAPYLPYGLKIRRMMDGHISELISLNINDYLVTNAGNIPYRMVKPILRPLSELIKNITYNGETFVPLRIYYKEELPHDPLSTSYKQKPKDLLNLDYWFIEKLFEWHFDVFGLIRKGLAVDVNSFDKNPYE